MDPGTAAARFVAELRVLCTAPSGPQLVGARATPDGTAVVVYREAAGASLLGRRYRLDAAAQLFAPDSSPAYLAGVAYADDLCDPSGTGWAADVDWADDVVPDPRAVGWLLGEDEVRELREQGRLR